MTEREHGTSLANAAKDFTPLALILLRISFLLTEAAAMCKYSLANDTIVASRNVVNRKSYAMEQFKNEQQIEFIALVRSAGWSPAQTARVLHLSKASVSRILSGQQTPRSHTLEALRNAVATHNKKIFAPLEAPGGNLTDAPADQLTSTEVFKILDDVRVIAETDPDKARQLGEIAKTYRQASGNRPNLRKETGEKPTSSAPVPDARPKSSPSPRADGSNEKTSKPKPGIGKRHTPQPGSPAQVPTEPKNE